MEYIVYAILFVFGLLIGSFLNVVILRFDTGLPVSKGRSACFSCGKTLEWYELVPVLSFIFLRGRCRGCKSTISWQYPFVEMLAGLAFVLAFIRTESGPYPSLAFVLVAALLCLYIVICVYDLRHKIIPDIFSYGAALIALGLLALYGLATGSFPFSNVFAGIGLFSFFFLFWFLSRGTWMGLGDAKLALSVGFFLGVSKGIGAILLSFWIGAAVTLLLMLFQRLLGRAGRLGFKSEVPFGPFILIGFLIAFLWNADVQSILSFLAL